MPRKRKSTSSSAELAAPVQSVLAAPDSVDSEGTIVEQPRGLATLATKSFVYAGVPVLLAIFGSLNALWNGFAADDTQQILNNALIRDLKNIPFAFTNSVWSFAASDIIFTVDSYYRPLFNVLLAINYAIFGSAAWGWHLVSVLIHAAVTLLVFKVLFELTEERWLSMASACLFAVHPAHAESVAWLSGVTDPLIALVLLPAFFFYLRFKKTERKLYLALTLLLYFLGLLCKETALAFPLILIYCEVFHFSERPAAKKRIRAGFLLGLLLLAPTAVYFLMRYGVLGSVLFGSDPRYPLGPALMTIPLALAKYLKLMLVPWGYSYQHLTYFVDGVGSIRFIAPLASLVALTVCVLLSRSKLLLFSAVWFIVWLAPSLAALRQFDPEYMVQERYLYMPSVGFCLAAGLGIQWLARRSSSAAAAVLGLMVVAYGSVYFVQNRIWDSTLSVFRNCVAVAPDSAQAHSALARTYFPAGNPRDAEAHARKALELDPQFEGGYSTLSYFNKQYGKPNQAIDYLEQATSAIELSPMTRRSLATIHLNLGLLYADRKDATRAEENLRRSVDLWSRAVGWHHLGTFYQSHERYEEAKVAFEEALKQVPPRYAPIHASLGAVYQHLGDADRARAEYNTYLELAMPNAPDRAEVLKQLSALSGDGGKK